MQPRALPSSSASTSSSASSSSSSSLTSLFSPSMPPTSSHSLSPHEPLLSRQLASLSFSVDTAAALLQQQRQEQLLSHIPRQRMQSVPCRLPARTADSSFSPSSTLHQQLFQYQSHPPSQTNLSTPYPGMKDVPYWLKTLRLHKYTTMMGEMSYEEMIELDEEKLERRAITKGARRKILQSIGKLKQRPVNVRRLEMNFDAPDACLRCAIVELRQLVATPILPYTPKRGETLDHVDGNVPAECIPDENLPALMMRLLFRVYSTGVCGEVLHEQVKPELLLMYFTVCDRMLMNEAFTSSQKRRIVQWRRAARRFASPADLRRVVLPHPLPPSCEACAPVSSYYFNDNMEEILRVQNLQRLVKQYVSSDNSFWQQPNPVTSGLQRTQPSCDRTHHNNYQVPQMYSSYTSRPSPLAKKLYPRGGPVSAPPPSLAAYYGFPPSAVPQQPLRPSVSYSTRNAPEAAAPKSRLPPVAPVAWNWTTAYSSTDVLELTKPLDMEGLGLSSASSEWKAPFQPAPTPFTPTEHSESTSGYSSSSERGSGAGSPRCLSGSAPSETPSSPPSGPPSAPAVSSFDSDLTVFDFCHSSRLDGGDCGLASFCRNIVAEMRAESA